MENQPTLEAYIEQLWLGTLQDEKIINCKIVCKEGEIPVGEISVSAIDTDTPEVGIKLLMRYRYQGIGARVMMLFLDKLKQTYEAEYFFVRIRSDNQISQKKLQKLGAVAIGDEGRESAELMQKIMVEMGKEQFEKTIGQPPEKALAYTICYRIDV